MDVAHDGQQALDKRDFTPYDVVVLNRDLPVVHGDIVCRRLARRGGARILMLTASGAVSDRVDGPGLGADDYLGKPFAFSELVARVRAPARRSTPSHPPVLRARDVELDPSRRTAERDGRLLSLTPKEFGVMERLSAADGAVSAETLLDKGVRRARRPVHRRGADHRQYPVSLTLLLLLSGSLRLPSPGPNDMRREAIFDLLIRAALALPVVTVPAGLTGWLVAGRILRPIRAISAAANRQSAKNLSERVPVRQPTDELATLAATINGMSDRIQHGLAERDRVLKSQRLVTGCRPSGTRSP